MSLTLQNNGNKHGVGHGGPGDFAIVQPRGAGGQTVVTTPLRVKLKPGQSRGYRVKFVVPAGTAAGSYYLAGSLAVGALGDTTAADGMAVSAMPVTVS